MNILINKAENGFQIDIDAGKNYNTLLLVAKDTKELIEVVNRVLTKHKF